MTTAVIKGGLTGAAEDYGAGFAHGSAGEMDELVLADHDLLYQLAPAQLHCARGVKRARYLAPCTEEKQYLVRSFRQLFERLIWHNLTFGAASQLLQQSKQVKLAGDHR